MSPTFEDSSCSASEQINLQQLRKEVMWLKSFLTTEPYRVALCHNDVQALNIVYEPISEKITFIDMEYASYNYCYFDIANHFCEYGGFLLSTVHNFIIQVL